MDMPLQMHHEACHVLELLTQNTRVNAHLLFSFGHTHVPVCPHTWIGHSRHGCATGCPWQAIHECLGKLLQHSLQVCGWVEWQRVVMRLVWVVRVNSNTGRSEGVLQGRRVGGSANIDLVLTASCTRQHTLRWGIIFSEISKIKDRGTWLSFQKGR